jgi:hypothetical protein
MLANLAVKCVLEFNSGKVPDIQDIWTYICQNGCLSAAQKAEASFRTLISEIRQFPSEDVDWFGKQLE